MVPGREGSGLVVVGMITLPVAMACCGGRWVCAGGEVGIAFWTYLWFDVIVPVVVVVVVVVVVERVGPESRRVGDIVYFWLDVGRMMDVMLWKSYVAGSLLFLVSVVVILTSVGRLVEW